MPAAILPTALLFVYLIVANHFGWTRITSTFYVPITLTFFPPPFPTFSNPEVTLEPACLTRSAAEPTSVFCGGVQVSKMPECVVSTFKSVIGFAAG